MHMATFRADCELTCWRGLHISGRKARRKVTPSARKPAISLNLSRKTNHEVDDPTPKNELRCKVFERRTAGRRLSALHGNENPAKRIEIRATTNEAQNEGEQHRRPHVDLNWRISINGTTGLSSVSLPGRPSGSRSHRKGGCHLKHSNNGLP